MAHPRNPWELDRPPPSGRRPDAGGLSFLAPGDQGTSHHGQQGAWRATPEGGRGSREQNSDRGWSPPREAGLGLEEGSMREEEGTPPHVPFIPDLFVPIPGGGLEVLPLPGRRGTGQLEPD